MVAVYGAALYAQKVASAPDFSMDLSFTAQAFHEGHVGQGMLGLAALAIPNVSSTGVIKTTGKALDLARRILKPNKIEKTIKQIEKFVGKDAKLMHNKSGDAFIMSKNMDRKVRFDLKNPHGLDPHMHLEKLNSKGKWSDAAPVHHIYPKGK